MAHLRTRYILPLIRSGLKHKGIVGIFGHRQVGKTTVLEQVAGRYVTCDRSADLQRSFESPEGFLDSLLHPPFPLAIDECQMSPPLFPALKDRVRTDRRPGLFLLSGSVRFSSRKAIRESLTGRMLSCELLPFSVSELRENKINTLPLNLMDCRGFSGLGLAPPGGDITRNPHAARYLRLGGLPGICFTRNDRDRNDMIESQLDLILDRDLRLVCDTSLPLSRLKELARHLAHLQNIPLNLSELARKSRISAPTLRKIIAGLESIFFIRIIPCEGDERRDVILLEDQGEASHLASLRLAGDPRSAGDLVSDLERLAFAHLRIPFAYGPGVSWTLTQFRRQGGAYVPFVFRSAGRAVGFLCVLDAHPPLGAVRSAGSFLKENPKAKAVYLHPGRRIHVMNERELVLPIELVL